jgi:hypothetical protein
MFKHRVQYRNEFSHTSCQSHLFTFSGSTKTIVKSADNRIKPCGNQSGHIKHRSHSTSSSPDTSSPMISATVPVKGCYPDQSRYLPPVQRSYFGKRAYNGRGEGRTNSRHTLKKTVFLLPIRLIFYQLHDVPVSISQFILQPDNMGFYPLLHVFWHPSKTIVFGSNHLDDLSTPGLSCLEFLRIRNWTWFRLNRRTEVCDCPSIEYIRFRQFTGAAGKVPYLSGIHRRGWQTGFIKSKIKRHFIPACCFKNHQVRLHLFEFPAEFGYAGAIIAELQSLRSFMNGYIQTVFRNIDSYIHFPLYLFSGPFLARCGLTCPNQLFGLFLYFGRDDPCLRTVFLYHGRIGLPRPPNLAYS